MKFTRAVTLARYNWPLYLICIVSSVAGFFVGSLNSLPVPVRIIAIVGASIATWYAAASFVAFHMMFERPAFLSGRWLSRCVSNVPKTCTHLSVCVEETSLPVQAVFPNTICTNLDLFDDSVMTEPAIARAKLAAGLSKLIRAKPNALPLENGVSELTVVSLAAHEVRDPTLRVTFFRELARVTHPDGTLVVAEHLRNLPAALAFGPGLFHFYPRSEWTQLATAAGLLIESEFDITPFIHVFVFRRDHRIGHAIACRSSGMQ